MTSITAQNQALPKISSDSFVDKNDDKGLNSALRKLEEAVKGNREYFKELEKQRLREGSHTDSKSKIDELLEKLDAKRLEKTLTALDELASAQETLKDARISSRAAELNSKGSKIAQIEAQIKSIKQQISSASAENAKQLASQLKSLISQLKALGGGGGGGSMPIQTGGAESEGSASVEAMTIAMSTQVTGNASQSPLSSSTREQEQQQSASMATTNSIVKGDKAEGKDTASKGSQTTSGNHESDETETQQSSIMMSIFLEANKLYKNEVSAEEKLIMQEFDKWEKSLDEWIVELEQEAKDLLKKLEREIEQKEKKEGTETS